METKRRGRGPSYPPEVIAEVRRLYAADHTPTDIARRLRRRNATTAPPVSTIKSWVSGQKRDSGHPWDFLGATLEECALLAPAFGYGLDRSAETGMDHWPTQGEATWMIRIAELAPGYGSERTYELARYAAAVGKDEAEVRKIATGLLMLAADPAPAPERVDRLRTAGSIGGTAIPELSGSGDYQSGGAAIREWRDER